VKPGKTGNCRRPVGRRGQGKIVDVLSEASPWLPAMLAAIMRATPSSLMAKVRPATGALRSAADGVPQRDRNGVVLDPMAF